MEWKAAKAGGPVDEAGGILAARQELELQPAAVRDELAGVARREPLARSAGFEEELAAALVEQAARIRLFTIEGAGKSREISRLPGGRNGRRRWLLVLALGLGRAELVLEEDLRDLPCEHAGVRVLAVAQHDH